MTHICVTNLGHHWFTLWLVACSAPNHYLNQCCIVVNWTLTNKIQSNCVRNSNIFIQENAFENVFWKMLAILSHPQCVKNEALYGCQFFKRVAVTWLKIGPPDNSPGNCHQSDMPDEDQTKQNINDGYCYASPTLRKNLIFCSFSTIFTINSLI